MTNKTLYVVLASLLIVLLGFGSFYLLKIRPMQQALALAQQNTTMYQQLTAANQKNYKKQKEKAKQNAAAKKNKINADKVNKRILPADPNLESFLVDFQSKAAKYGVTIDTVSRASASDNGNSAAVNAAASNSGSTASEVSTTSASNSADFSSAAVSSASSSTSTASSNTQNAGSSSAQNSVASAASALHADNLAITLNAPSQTNITLFVGYLESLKRLLVITNYTMQASEQAITTDTSSPVSSTRTSSSGESNSANSSSSDSSSAVPTIPIVQATMTLTLFSAK
ncbi:hypothetical protein [Sporolactobacillus spathodeae]|uniref:Uncharacterized protein n=1 Tax=Sporolactobacillus spathodeae TaxID=1465502 RepID=A0ABS2Q6I4_9BACL|nr:hypothetical protein [Sporolactobacillus spathodeae]MBM7657413.1 hypothetical protein [Sporolactobacillus spathodeae]